MAGWKDRAAPVDDSGSGGGWRDRAEAIEPQQEGLPGKGPVYQLQANGPPIRTDQPSNLDVAHAGIVNGALKGWADELAGQYREKGVALRNLLNGQPQAQLDPNDYREGRDIARTDIERASKANPGLFGAANVAGDLATDIGAATFVPGGKAIFTPAGQGAVGLVSGLGNSSNELTTDKTSLKDVGGAALDTAINGAGNFVLSKAGNKLASTLENSSIGKYLASKLRGATADAGQLVAGKANKALRSGVASLGGETSAGSRTLEVLENTLSNPAATQEQKLAAKTFLESPEGLELKRGVIQGHLERAPGQLGRINQAQEALKPLQAAATPEAINQATDEYLKGGLAAEAKPRLAKYLTRTIPAAAGAWAGNKVGDMVGDNEHGLVSRGVGTMVGATLGAAVGDPGTALANMLKSPRFRAGVWGLVKDAITTAPAKLGQYLGPLQRLGQVAHETLLKHDPGYAQKVQDLAQAQEPEGNK